MQEKKPGNPPESITAYRLILLIMLWVFILLWIMPLASFAECISASNSISSSGVMVESAQPTWVLE